MQKAFTLLEVMIALMVITIGLGAAIQTTASSTWRATTFKQKTIGNWVAQNQLALYRAKRIWGSTTSKQGTVEMANVEWRYEMTITKTPNTSIRSVEVEVYLEGQDELIARLTGYASRL